MKVNNSFEIPSISGGADSSKPVEGGFDFKKMLVSEVNKINDAEKASLQLDKAIITGDINNLHEAMIASQKAEITLDFAVQVKTKAVEAYKEILRMQL